MRYEGREGANREDRGMCQIWGCVKIERRGLANALGSEGVREKDRSLG
jgi:hypothetical protein